MINIYGNDLFGEPVKQIGRGSVSDKFIFPPFSVLNSRDGFWQNRKKMWLNKGISSEAGRGSGDGLGHKIMTDWATEKKISGKAVKKRINDSGNGASVFDPVLCELIYKWFCPPSGRIIDPFAGGSVRGIVASLLDFKYWGCDLSEIQIDNNVKQAEIICSTPDLVWISGDSENELKNAPEADLIFSCPPYGDIEKYSKDPRDLSNMGHDEFLSKYRKIIRKASEKLIDNRFACFVVGDFRDKEGFYRNFVSETISCFESAGLRLYNHAILITPVGSGALLVSKYFSASRKMLKVHQDILVFVKGDPKKATDALNPDFGPVKLF